MIGSVRRPWTRRLLWLPRLAAAGAALAAFFWTPVDAQRVNPQPKARVVARELARLERTWVDADLPAAFLPSPPRLEWCIDGFPRSPGKDELQVRREVSRASREADIASLSRLHAEGKGWFSSLALADRHIQEGQPDPAEEVLTQALARLRGRVNNALIISQESKRREARGQPLPPPSEPDLNLLALIEIQHAIGALRLERNLAGRSLWEPLKNAIGCAKLVVHYDYGTVATEVRRRLRAPGCTSPSDLTTHDLYNNLIIAYLKAQDFSTPQGEQREDEFRRRYTARTEPIAQNPMFAAVRLLFSRLPPAAPAGGSTAPGAQAQESRVWAVSNAERVLRAGRIESFDPRLCVTLAQAVGAAIEDLGPVFEAGQKLVIDSQPLAQSAEDLRQALEQQRDKLIECARDGVQRLPDSDQLRANQALARLVLVGAIRRGRSGDDVTAGLADESAKNSAQAVQVSLQRRIDLPTLLSAVASPPEELGPRADNWHRAAALDAAASLGLYGQGLGGRDRASAAQKARAYLEAGDSAPTELAALEARLGPWRVLTAYPLVFKGLFAMAAALFIWYLTKLVVLQLRAYSEQFTSFYRIEAQARLRSDRDRGLRPERRPR